MNDININELEIHNIQDMVNSTNMSMDGSTLILSIIFGIIGMLYFSIGRKQEDKDMFFFSGIGLMAFPYFIEGQTNTLLAGFALMAIPFIIRR